MNVVKYMKQHDKKKKPNPKQNLKPETKNNWWYPGPG